MRFAPLLVLALTACAAPPVAPTEPPPVSVSDARADIPEVCGDVPYRPLQNTRQNVSLAAEFSRAAASATETSARLESTCAATVYLRWLIANAPTETGGTPDDRHFRRLADAEEFFASVPSTDRRAHLDAALALRAEADRVRQSLGLDVQRWASSLREGVLIGTYPDAFENAGRRQFEAFSRAFEAEPERVDDWYLRKLVELSAEWTNGVDERVEYLAALADHVDDPEYRAYVLALVEALRQPAGVAPVTRYDLAAFEQGSYGSCEPRDEVEALFWFATQQPERIEEEGGDADRIRDALLDCFTDEVDDPVQLVALFQRSWTRGDRDLAESYFERALAAAGSDRQRAEFWYARAQRDQGDTGEMLRRALEALPAHGPSLYLRATRLAGTIGRPSALTEQAAYWCLADAFERVAATGDERVAEAARATARRYATAGPSREDYFFADWSPGQTIRASSGAVTCTTRVR